MPKKEPRSNEPRPDLFVVRTPKPYTPSILAFSHKNGDGSVVWPGEYKGKVDAIDEIDEIEADVRSICDTKN